MYIHDLIFIKPLETGGYSVVWKVKYKQSYYALKMISKNKYISKIDKKRLKTEIKIHKELDHANIIKMYNSFEDNFFVYILLELSDTDLFNFYDIKQMLTDDEILKISYEIIKGLVYLNEKNIIHSDIKIENILLDKNGENVKLCDFGFATINSYHFNRIGTPEYMAPEIINRQVYDYKIDIWSFGILLYYLVFSDYPEPTLTFPKYTKFNELIKQCLTKERVYRISIQELKNHSLYQNLF
jgi:serine/threonine protein kinase